jgi:ribosomal protein S18 acetylase RimI-like enzyme
MYGEAENPATDDGDATTLPKIEIATATEDDIPGIQLAAAQSWRAAYAEIFTSDFIESFVGRAYSTESLRRVIHSTQSIFVVAREDQEIIGFSHAGFGPRGAELYRIYLRPAWWGSGLGDLLLKQTEQWLRDEGYPGYGCYVHKRNTVGQRFYAKHRFVRMDVPDEGDDDYLWKALV